MTMPIGRLKVERALRILPELEELLPLRSMLISGAHPDADLAWSDSDAYPLVDTRLLDPAQLERDLPEVVERARQRTEAVYGGVVAAVRAVGARDFAAAAIALVEAGEAHEAIGGVAAARAYFAKALELGRKASDRRGELLALRRLAWLARGQGELDAALRYYEAALAVAEALGDVEASVVARQGIGNVQVDQGRWDEARLSYHRGLDRLGSQAPSRMLWQLQSNLSIVARRSGDLVESRRWLERAVATAEGMPDPTARVYLRNAEGLLWMASSEPDRAETLYREALGEAGTPTERATVLINLAECLLEQQRVAQAERVARELERLTLAGGLVAFLPFVYRSLGAVARARRDENGFLFYEQALALHGDPPEPPFEAAVTQHEYGLFEAALGRAEAARARFAVAESLFERVGARHERERVRSDLEALDRAPSEPSSGPSDPDSGA